MKPRTAVDGGGRMIGRYALHKPIAAGGMAIVHLGRLLGPVGFNRTVAIKRVHPNFVHDREFVAMFVDEARLAARIHHPNVVPTLDVVVDGEEMILVMEYIHGESLSKLVARAQRPLPLRVASAILTGVLHGLHAAHEAKSERGAPLDLVHRDVSPQNILVGADGVARVFDFGVAKAAGRLQTTGEGNVKGKLAYMSPEQILSKALTRRSDLHAAAIVAWEVVTGARLFKADNEGAILQKILEGNVPPPSSVAPNVPPELDALILRGLAREPEDRFATAREMALALEACVPPALASEVATVVEALAGDALRERAEAIEDMERGGTPIAAPPSVASAKAVAASNEEPTRVTAEATQSQLSVISDSKPRSKTRASLFPKISIAALAVGAAAALIAVKVGRSSRFDGASIVPIAAPSDAPSAAPSASAPPSPSIAVAPAVASIAPAEPSTSAPIASTRAAPPARPTAPATPAKKRGCDPPYTIDASGKKTYKRECF